MTRLSSALALYRRYVAASFRGQMQYPASFLATTTGAFAVNIAEFGAIWALFARFDHIEGWRFEEIAVFYGVVSVAFAVADGLTRGFDVFGPQFVKTGDFDRLLVRPRSTILQLFGYELRATRVGRLAQGAIVWGIGAHLSPVPWGWSGWAVLVLAVAGGAALFTGILILQATLAFWTVESLEIGNTLTYGSIEAAQYPLDIYSRWLRGFLTYVVPLACVTYFPVSYVLGRAERAGAPAAFLALAPLVGFAFFGMSLLVWRLGVRRYTSTGS